jgi:uncharacterized damage-inducible protein DinB
MKTTLLILCSVGLAAAQAPDFKSAAGGVKTYYTQVKNNIIRSADKMSEENYSFKPTPEVRSFGQLVGHVADASYTFCSAASGEKNPSPGIEKGKSGKADLAAAVKEAFAYCDKVYDGLTDAGAATMVKFFGGERSKLNVLEFNVMHDWEHYGNMVTYMRLKGVVPPSSEPRR